TGVADDDLVGTGDLDGTGDAGGVDDAVENGSGRSGDVDDGHAGVVSGHVEDAAAERPFPGSEARDVEGGHADDVVDVADVENDEIAVGIRTDGQKVVGAE